MIVHEDWDDVDGDGWTAARQRVQQAIEAAAGRGRYVLAVWEMEAWLLLFPDALAGVVSTWSVPRRYAGRDTGLLTDPKKILKTECSGRGRRYHEADATAVLQVAVAKSLFDQPVGRNRSWAQLRHDIQRCCTDHLGRARR